MQNYDRGKGICARNRFSTAYSGIIPKRCRFDILRKFLKGIHVRNLRIGNCCRMISVEAVSTSETQPVELIVDRIKNGEQSAFAELYDQHAGAIYGVTLKIVRSEEAAEDVLQDAFLKIWKNIHAYDSARGTVFT